MILVENFSFLVDRLVAFDDPSIQYKAPLLKPTLRGGMRRIYRANNYGSSAYYSYMAGATIDITMTDKISFGDISIPVTEYRVSHSDIKANDLGEKYPANTYTCKVTSKTALEKKETDRVYVYCSCDDFRHTFQHELIEAGYTLEDASLPAPTGKKKLAPAICKHLFSILMRKYSFILMKESSVDPDATTDAFMPKMPQGPAAAPAQPPMVTPPASVAPPAPVGTPAVPPATQKLRPKAQNIKDLMAKLSILDAQAEQQAVKDPVAFMTSKYSEFYRDPRVTSTQTYHTTKFKTRSFNGIWMIVYTNPGAWGAAKTVVLPDNYKGKAVDFYKLLQSYGTLREIINAVGTELPENIREYIWSLKVKNQKLSGATQYAMVESIEYDELELSDSITSLLEEYI